MRPSSLLLLCPIVAIHCKGNDAVGTGHERGPLDAGGSNMEAPRTDSGDHDSIEAGADASLGPAQGDCFTPQQNQVVDYASSQGCRCTNEEPVCVASAAGELQDLACVEGVWSAVSSGPCLEDMAGESCRDPFDCVSLVGYRCQGLDAWNDGDDVEPVWVLDATVHCPMLTEDQCSELEDNLEALIAGDNDCDTDDDCVQLGGVRADEACDCFPFLGPYAASLLGDIEAAQATFAELEAGGCAEAICDAPPQNVECVDGTCQVVGPDSCLPAFEGDSNSGFDGGF